MPRTKNGASRFHSLSFRSLGYAFRSSIPPFYCCFSTLQTVSKRGRIIESMHVSLFRTETQQNFNIWVYGNEKLARGSGLFVGENGIAANHHFLTPEDAKAFRFSEGEYTLKVFTHLLGNSNDDLIFTVKLHVASDIAARLQVPNTGLYFDWAPSSKSYLSHVEERIMSPSPEELLKWMMPERVNDAGS